MKKAENDSKNRKNIKNILWVIIGICATAIIVTVIIFVPKVVSGDKPNSTVIDEIKNPESYTWEQYQALTPEEKMMFPDYFENMDEYNVWYESVAPTGDEGANIPKVDLAGKNPEDFTWEDYQKLSIEEKMIFPDYFDSFEAYQKWYDSVCEEN